MLSKNHVQTISNKTFAYSSSGIRLIKRTLKYGTFQITLERFLEDLYLKGDFYDF